MEKNIFKQSPVYDSLYDQYSALDLPMQFMGPDQDFTIFNLENLNRSLPFKSPVSRLNFFVFVFVKNGSGYYLVDDVEYSTEPHCVYFTNPGHWRSFTWHNVNSVCLITLSESFLKQNVHTRIFEEFPFLLSETFPAKKISDESFQEFETLCNQIKSLQTSDSSLRRRMIGGLFSVILLKIKELFWQGYDARAEGNRSSNIVRDFKILLDEHYADLVAGRAKVAFLAHDYASKLRLHPNYLNSVIKIKTGRPISSWIAEKNIAEAKSLLTTTNESIKVIAYLLGFTRSGHFSTCFKRHTGSSPITYRNSYKIDQEIIDGISDSYLNTLI